MEPGAMTAYPYSQQQGSLAVPKVFLSHSRQDSRFMKRLHDDLQRCHMEPWLDVEEIRHGRPWMDAIFQEGIPACDSILVYLTPSSVQSKMVQKEIDAALIRQLEDSRIAFLPYISDGALRRQLRTDLQALQIPVLNATNYDDLLPCIVGEIWQSFWERCGLTMVPVDRVASTLVFPPAVLQHCLWLFREKCAEHRAKVSLRCDAQITITKLDGTILNHPSPSILGGFTASDHVGEILWTSFETSIKHRPFRAALLSDEDYGAVLWHDRGYSYLERPVKQRDSIRICLAFFRKSHDRVLFLEVHHEVADQTDRKILSNLAWSIPERLRTIDWKLELGLDSCV